MDINEVVTQALQANFSEFTEDQAAAVIEAIKANGFVVMPKEPNYEIIKSITSYILGEDQHGTPVGLMPNEAKEIYKVTIQAIQEPAND